MDFSNQQKVSITGFVVFAVAANGYCDLSSDTSFACRQIDDPEFHRLEDRVFLPAHSQGAYSMSASTTIDWNYR